MEVHVKEVLKWYMDPDEGQVEDCDEDLDGDSGVVLEEGVDSVSEAVHHLGHT